MFRYVYMYTGPKPSTGSRLHAVGKDSCRHLAVVCHEEATFCTRLYQRTFNISEPRICASHTPSNDLLIDELSKSWNDVRCQAWTLVYVRCAAEWNVPRHVDEHITGNVAIISDRSKSIYRVYGSILALTRLYWVTCAVTCSVMPLRLAMQAIWLFWIPLLCVLMLDFSVFRHSSAPTPADRCST
jgi:hypothetical protein